MQGAHTAAAQLEHYARYHLVGWTALLRVLRSDAERDVAGSGSDNVGSGPGVVGFGPDSVERMAAVRDALFENVRIFMLSGDGDRNYDEAKRSAAKRTG